MHVLFVHPNHPGQFGHIAEQLQRQPGWRCTFVTAAPGSGDDGVERVVYQPAAVAKPGTHFCARTFENAVGNCDGVYQALSARPDIRPDLVVGHGGFGTTLFSKELYPDVPVVNLVEHYYHPHGPLSDIDFRKDLGWKIEPETYQRARCRNAMVLLDLQNCDAAYAPTAFQKSLFPAEYEQRIRVLFDGVDRAIYHGHGDRLRACTGGRRKVAGVELGAATRVVTYVSRGFESMRGFDIFVRAAKLIAAEHRDVVFFVVGADRIAYGGDMEHIGDQPSFRAWAMARHEVDGSQLVFTGRLPRQQLALLLAASDLH